MLAEARGGEEAKKIAEERGSSGRSSGSGGDMHGSGRIALLRLGIHIYMCVLTGIRPLLCAGPLRSESVAVGGSNSAPRVRS